MNETKSLGIVISRLEKLFQTFNERFYAGELQAPVIIVSPDITGKGNILGWCTGWKAWKDDVESKDGYYEIAICAEYLNRPFEAICETMLHEMAHLSNTLKDVKDTSRGGTYHNKRYKEVAEAHGLLVLKSEKNGWSVTSLNPEALNFVNTLQQDMFDFFRTPIPQSMKKAAGKSSSRKYVCPLCGAIIRATKEVRVICGECDVEFELDEG